MSAHDPKRTSGVIEVRAECSVFPRMQAQLSMRSK